jgi:hypothetical protein
MSYPPLPTVTYADFIVMFPEFSNTATYPEAQFNAWLPVAIVSLNPNRLWKVWSLAVMLFIAHNIVLSARNQAAANSGAVVGDVKGVVTQKAVGDVSIGYDANSVAIAGAGMWNSTSYGARLYKMFQSYGVGPNYAAAARPNPGRGPFPVPRRFS